VRCTHGATVGKVDPDQIFYLGARGIEPADAMRLIVTGFVDNAILSVGGMSDINGGRAMVAFFTFAPFGAIAGLILGVWLVLRRRIGKPGLARVAGYSALAVLPRRCRRSRSLCRLSLSQ
jgi:hypothetical protein